MNYKTHTLVAICATVILGAATTASADYSINQKKVIKAEDKRLATKLKTMHRYCDSTMKASIHWPSFISQVDKKVDGTLRTSISAYCSDVITGLFMLCKEDPEYKKAIRTKIKSYECRYVEGKKNRKMTFKKGKLTLHMPWDSRNLRDFVDKFLGGVL